MSKDKGDLEKKIQDFKQNFQAINNGNSLNNLHSSTNLQFQNDPT